MSDGMPFSEASERAVIFLAAAHPDECMDTLAAHLRPADFYLPAHRRLFEILNRMRQNRVPISEPLVVEWIWKDPGPNLDGPTLFLAFSESLSGGGTTPRHVNWHIEQLIEHSIRRCVISEADKLRSEAADALGGIDGRSILNDAEARLRGLRRELPGATAEDLKDLIFQLQDYMHDRAEGGMRTSPIQTGFESIDRERAGPSPGEMVIVAARPSVGKTALALQVALHAAKWDAPAHFFSLEMPPMALAARAVAHLSQIDLRSINCGKLEPGELARYHEAMNDFQIKMKVNSKRRLNIAELCADARDVHRVMGTRVIIVDYLGLVTSTLGDRAGEVAKVGQVTRELKLLALELNVPIILLAQLNRESEKRENSEPRLSDLRSSGDIEQDADQVWMIHAPHGIESSARTLYFRKGRNTGIPAPIEMSFFPLTQQFIVNVPGDNRHHEYDV